MLDFIHDEVTILSFTIVLTENLVTEDLATKDLYTLSLIREHHDSYFCYIDTHSLIETPDELLFLFFHFYS